MNRCGAHSRERSQGFAPAESRVLVITPGPFLVNTQQQSIMKSLALKSDSPARDTHLGQGSQFFHLSNGNTDAYRTGLLWMVEKIHLRQLEHCLIWGMCSANTGRYHCWESPDRSLCMNTIALTTSCHPLIIDKLLYQYFYSAAAHWLKGL